MLATSLQKTASEWQKLWHFSYRAFWSTGQCRGHSVPLAKLLITSLVLISVIEKKLIQWLSNYCIILVFNRLHAQREFEIFNAALYLDPDHRRIVKIFEKGGGGGQTTNHMQ